MRNLIIMSNTYYGRGTPLTGEQVRRRIDAVRSAFDEIAPGVDIHGCCDEDYGWYCELTPELESEILQRYPNSLVLGEMVCVHNHGKYQDQFTTSKEVVTAFITDIKGRSVTSQFVNKDKMFEDWFDNYGKY